MRVLILGVTGMLGSTVFKVLSSDTRYVVRGMGRDSSKLRMFFKDHTNSTAQIESVESDSIISELIRSKPDVVINCVGVIKQSHYAEDPLVVLPVNSLLPHRLARLCELAGSRLIHISSDCVFSGRRGNYSETDIPDAYDLYGRSKALGEVTEKSSAVTLRTSIIGHELGSNLSLLDWFLSQESAVKGYSKAIFSGLPAYELARVIRDLVLPNPNLSGLYHVGSSPITKFKLLRLVSTQYQKRIDITADESVVVDRSLNSDRFRCATGYVASDWPELIREMWQFGFQLP